jgi:hypothetical protein
MIMNKIPNSWLDRNKPTKPWLVIDARWMMVFPITFALIAVLGLSIGGWNFVEGYGSRHWPQCQGYIVSARVTPHQHRFTADISYKYDLAGATYSGNRVAFLQHSFDGMSPAQALVDRFPKGKEIPVFYSPGNPERAVLEPGITFDIILLLVVGVLALVGAVGLARQYGRRKKAIRT